MVVVSERAFAQEEWRAVAEALAEKNAARSLTTRIVKANPSAVSARIRNLHPRYVAFVLLPDEAGAATVTKLHGQMRSLDDDPFTDAVWGIVTGRDAAAAKRLASSAAIHPRTLLSTTGVDMRVFDEAATISDAYVSGKGREDYANPLEAPVATVVKRAGGEPATAIETGGTHAAFASSWKKMDPQFIVTSAHASERTLEMPFSTGNISARDGVLASGWTLASRPFVPLAKPRNDKIWIAAGNCLIANYDSADSMAAAILDFGRCVQFVGYVKPSWYGEIGWSCLSRFMDRGETVAEAWYFSLQNLDRKLPAGGKNVQGRIYDRDATALFGDPALDASLPAERVRRAAVLEAIPENGGVRLAFRALEDIEAAEDTADEIHAVRPYGVFLPRRDGPWRTVSGAGLGIFAADDFAFVFSWPKMAKGEVREALLPAPVKTGD